MKNDIPLQSPDFSKHSHGVAANDAGGIAMDIHQDIRRYIIDDLLLGTACGLDGWRLGDVVPQLDALTRAAALVEESLARG